MTGLISRAFSPSGVSSFFEICDREADGTPILDSEKIGARGGGFALSKGVTTEVEVKKSKANRVDVFINGKPAPEAKTTQTMARMLLKEAEGNYLITVRHEVEVPIGAGFGTSAAGAFSCGLALSHALGLDLTYNQIGRMAHVAEVLCGTGLGTVEGLMVGGLVLVVKSGAVGIGLVDRIPIASDLRVVAGSFSPIETRSVIFSPEKRPVINKLAQKTMERIMAEPSLENFMQCCEEFAYGAGLASARVSRLIREAKKAGAIGATQNMIGEAIHAVLRDENLDSVYNIFKKHLPGKSIVVSNIDFEGARLIY